METKQAAHRLESATPAGDEMRARVTYIDLETPMIGRGADSAPRPIIVSVYRPHADEHYLARACDVDWSFLSTDLIAGVNIAYDMSCLIRHVPEIRARILRAYAERRVIDVGLAHILLSISYGSPAGSWGLEALAEKYLGIELDKDTWRTEYVSVERIPLAYWPAGAVRYALDDTAVPARVLTEMLKHDEHGALGLLGHLTAAAWGLHEAEVEGVPTDPDRARALVAGAARREQEVLQALQEAGLVRPDGAKDTKAAAQRALEAGVRKRTAGGAVSLSVESTAASKDPVLQMYTEYTQAGKMRTAARALLDGFEQPMQTRFNACMETYRTSSSMPAPPLRGVQMQNPWRTGGFREVFRPDHGEVFIGSDYAMAELYSLSALCRHKFGYSIMGDALSEGKDLHLVTGANIAGVSYEQVLVHPKKKELRQASKALNFGIPGGLGAAKMCDYGRVGYGVVKPESEWRELIRGWRALYREVDDYLYWIGLQGYPWTLVHPITGYVRGGVGYTDGANTGFQHLTAYYAKTAVARVAAARWDEASPLYGFKIWNFVHDEIICRGPESRAHAAAAELARIMCEAADEVLGGLRMKSDPWVADVWSKMVEDPIGLDDGGIWRLARAVDGWRTLYYAALAIAPVSEWKERAAAGDKVCDKGLGAMKSLKAVGATV